MITFFFDFGFSSATVSSTTGAFAYFLAYTIFKTEKVIIVKIPGTTVERKPARILVPVAQP